MFSVINSSRRLALISSSCLVNMFNKHIILWLCVCLSGVLCDLNKEEGADCEWEGVKGKCVKETRCMTTLDKRSPKQPVCSKQGDVSIICCTDCTLVNDTRNVVFSPNTGILWKDGKSKARDNCLTYLDDLPYQCRQGGFYSGITRSLDEDKKCHKYDQWGIGGSAGPEEVPGAQYPHQALLGFGEDLKSAKWLAGGSIISDRYILTAAHPNAIHEIKNIRIGNVKFVAVGVKNISDSSPWQTFKVKRFISHPDFKQSNKHHDIGLIELETPIKFDKDVLPACLHVEEAEAEKAVTTTWPALRKKLPGETVETIQTINLEKFSDEECNTIYSKNNQVKLDFSTQMCYGSKSNPSETCQGLSGEPLLIDTQFSSCIYTVIGVTTFGSTVCGPDSIIPDVYTKVAHYVPWIESIVWP